MARDAAVSPGRAMMSARSTPNLQQQTAAAVVSSKPPPPHHSSIYSYLHTQSGLNFAPVVQQQQQQQPPPQPPVRDASSLKGIKYGPGHEKFPSWPVPAAADNPALRSPPGGGSHRSKSWTDHTNYPKEKGLTYTRPYMKRPNPAFTQQLKTVMERCEKIPPETYESRSEVLEDSRLYLPRVDREGKALGDTDYMVPSPPERDVVTSKPQLTQADLEEYALSYQDPQLMQVDMEEYAYQEQNGPQQPHLTRADLEEYSRTYDESLRPQHQLQPSYAQSEGYHSYVSSSDSTTNTPFLDRLRRDSDAARPVAGPQTPWEESDRPGRDSVVTTSSGSASSSETLKWHGSLSDVSVASSSCTHLIAHSARVQTPQRHHSESVLYLGAEQWQAKVHHNNHHNKLRLFPVNTYTVQPQEQHRLVPLSPAQPTLSVAERISELERQQMRYTYLDPDKRHRVSDPTLKAIQKKALLSFYERHHSASSSRGQAWRSEPQLAQPPSPQSPPPQPPPRPRPTQSTRRASSASDYAGGAWREMAANRESASSETGSIRDGPRHQHSSSCGSLSTDLLGPLIVGPSISVDDWVPERPPKKPHLRAAFPPPVPDRLPSPDLPPPSPPTVLEDEVFASDEPLPPPPPELHPPDWSTEKQKKQSPTKVEPPCYLDGENLQRNVEPIQKCVESIMPSQRQCASATQRQVEKCSSPPKHQNTSPILQKQSGHDGSASQKTVETIAESQTSPSSETPNRTLLETSIRQARRSLNQQENSNARQRYVENGTVSQEALLNGMGKHKVEESKPATTKSPLESINVFHKRQENSCSSAKYSENSNGTHQCITKSWSSNKIQRSLENISSSQRFLDHSRNHPEGNGTLERNIHNFSATNQVLHNSSMMQRLLDHNNSSLKQLENGLHKNSQGDVVPYKHLNDSNSNQNGDSSHKYTENGVHNAIRNSVSHSRHTEVFTNTNHINQTRYENGSSAHPLESSLPNHSRYSEGGNSTLKYNTSPTQRHGDNTHPSQLSNSTTSYRCLNNAFTRSTSLKQFDNLGNHTLEMSSSVSSSVNRPKLETNWSSLKYPTQKLMVNGKLATSLSEWTAQPCSDIDKTCQRNGPVTQPSRARLQRVPSVTGNGDNGNLPVSPPSGSPTHGKPETHQKPQQLTEAISRLSVGHPDTKISPETCSAVPNPMKTTRPSTANSQSTSKASYLAYKRDRDRGLPNFEGSYKRTMSPSEYCDAPGVVSNHVTECERVPSVVDCPDEVKCDKKLPLDEVIPKTERPPSVVAVTEVQTQCDITPPLQRLPTPPPAVETLQLVQRTEVVLRVNAATSDASSQTEAEREVKVAPRQKLQEEIECERLSMDLASQLPLSDRLQGILVPVPEHKKPTDYVSGLFRLDITPRPRVPSRVQTPTTTNSSSSPPPHNGTLQPSETSESSSQVSPLPASSAYFTTSESKAKFLTRYGRDMSQSEQLSGLQDNKDLHQKKEELMTRLDRKLEVLRGEHLVVTEESRVNEELGESVAVQVSRLARPHEAAKYRLHVEEVGKITSLLLGLSGRLARAENALMGLPQHHTERKILENKRDKLKDQLEEAKKLKENIDRRSVSVSNILYKYFNAEEYADYDHFINMKAKLIMDSREIADKIKLGEEQLVALRETLSAPD